LAPPTEAPDPQTLALGALRTLIVDDNDVTREVLRRMVEPMGWQVDVAASGSQAIACINARAASGEPPYEVIFMDWQMPEMDGWETSQRVRTLAAGRTSPIVIMVTAHGREMLSQRSAAETAMINGFLVKPVTASMLLDAVMDAKSAAAAAAKGENPTAPKAPVRLKRLKGLRLLVVEDNKINQMVAKGLLTQEGAEVTLAENGQLGVDAVMRADPLFDAVLMDVQMPVMDGYEATQVIRQKLGLHLLPIIAMTANAMASDRAACLAAGMNDHVGKPFELDHLVAMLLRLGGPSDTGGDGAAHAPDERAAPTPWRGELDVAAALERMGGNTTMFSTVVHAFTKDLVQVPAHIAGHFAAGDISAAIRALHTLKGLAAMAGARDLSGLAARLESRLAAGLAASDQAGLVGELQRAVDGTSIALEPVLRQYPIARSIPPPQTVGGAPDKLLLTRDLEELRALLEASDMRALSVHTRIGQTHGAMTVPELGAIDEAMAALDFGLAAKLCQGILQNMNE
jgi:CheY-like chemotaxis protein